MTTHYLGPVEEADEFQENDMPFFEYENWSCVWGEIVAQKAIAKITYNGSKTLPCVLTYEICTTLYEYIWKCEFREADLWFEIGQWRWNVEEKENRNDLPD